MNMVLFFCLSLYYKAKTIFWRTNKSHIVYKIKVKNLRLAYRYFISIGFYQSATISNALQHNFIYKKGSISFKGYQYFGFTQYDDEGSFNYNCEKKQSLQGEYYSPVIIKQLQETNFIQTLLISDW